MFKFFMFLLMACGLGNFFGYHGDNTMLTVGLVVGGVGVLLFLLTLYEGFRGRSSSDAILVGLMGAVSLTVMSFGGGVALSLLYR